MRANLIANRLLNAPPPCALIQSRLRHWLGPGFSISCISTSSSRCIGSGSPLLLWIFMELAQPEVSATKAIPKIRSTTDRFISSFRGWRRGPDHTVLSDQPAASAIPGVQRKTMNNSQNSRANGYSFRNSNPWASEVNSASCRGRNGRISLLRMVADGGGGAFGDRRSAVSRRRHRSGAATPARTDRRSVPTYDAERMEGAG